MSPKRCASVDVSQLKKGEIATVISYRDGLWANRLMDLGIFPGSTVKVLARLPLGGPVLITLGRSKMALGQVVAKSIICEKTGSSRSVPVSR
jgi:Fe2+ transport system protein FeoA